VLVNVRSNHRPGRASVGVIAVGNSRPASQVDSSQAGSHRHAPGWTVAGLGRRVAVTKATEILEQLKSRAERAGSLTEEEVTHALASATGDESLEPTKIDVFQVGRTIRPRTAGQLRYVQTIREHDLVFSIGPAGSGKTYLAVALAVESLKMRRVRKIVLVRPAVEAGESLGFLPGDLQAKINPYLRPLMDALHEMIDHDQIKQYMEMDVIEVLPCLHARTDIERIVYYPGRGPEHDDPQMKMFLTRMGTDSKSWFPVT